MAASAGPQVGSLIDNIGFVLVFSAAGGGASILDRCWAACSNNDLVPIRTGVTL